LAWHWLLMAEWTFLDLAVLMPNFERQLLRFQREGANPIPKGARFAPS